jgi:hypothetical protein
MLDRRFRWALRLSGLLVLILAVCVAAGILGCNRNPGDPTADPSASSSPNPPEETTPPLTLDDDQRDYLWQIEHHGNLLSKHGFGAIKKALIKGDAQALAVLFAKDFTGAVYDQPREVRVANDFVQVARQQDAGKPRRQLTAAAFIERLLSYRRMFAGEPKVGINLMKLAPEETDNLESAFWQGSCLMRLWGEATPGKPTEISLNLEYRIPKPTKSNLEKPGWLHSAALAQSVVGHATHFLLRDVTLERGIDPSQFYDNWLHAKRKPIHGGVYFCDFDRDGILDLLVTDTNGNFLYKGLPGGKFRDVTQEMGLPREPVHMLANSSMAAFADLDGDGWEDLILGDRIFRNDQGKRFIDVTEQTRLRIPRDAGGIALADYDRDGRVDLYITRSGGAKKDSWLRGKSGEARGNELWRNKGNWEFEDVTEASGTSGDSRSTFTAVWLDANSDGWPDLYVINEFGNGVLLLNNTDGTFRKQQLAPGPNDFGTMGVTVGDIDNDNNIDIYCANMYSKAGSRVIGNLKPGTYAPDIMATMRQFVAGSQLWRNKGNLEFEKLGQHCQVAAVGWAYGAALVDLDNDGWLDLYATSGFMSSSRDEPDG